MHDGSGRWARGEIIGTAIEYNERTERNYATVGDRRYKEGGRVEIAGRLCQTPFLTSI
jgi:hypothetical protein